MAVDKIKVGMKLSYDGEPCVVERLRKISTGEWVEEARRKEFSDIVAVLVGDGWEARIRLVEEEVKKLGAPEEAIPAAPVAASSTIDEDRTPVDVEFYLGEEPHKIIEGEEEEEAPGMEIPGPETEIDLEGLE